MFFAVLKCQSVILAKERQPSFRRSTDYLIWLGNALTDISQTHIFVNIF